MALIVRRPGLLLTVQDSGRWGHQAEGVPVAGPMDPWSHRLANLAVGNPPDAAALEATLVGPELECERPVAVAVTGAAFVIEVGGRVVESPAVFDVKGGGSIRFRERVAGARACIAFAGGIDVPLILGSRSTDLRSGFGGFEGRALRAGDRVPLAMPSRSSRPQPAGPIPRGRLPLPGGITRLRVLSITAPSDERSGLLRGLTDNTFVLSTRSDRMGYRLEGISLRDAAPGTLVSMPTVTGLVQVPPNGEPILLMADRQTTGGYLPAAVVITADLPLAGQLAPGDRVQFVPCSAREAARALSEAERTLAEWR